MAWLKLPMRVVVSCDKLGRGAYVFWTQDCLMGLPKHLFFWVFDSCRIGNPLNWNILVSGGEERNISISWVTASENDLGQTESCFVNCRRCGVFDLLGPFCLSWSFFLECCAVEGDSPVDMWWKGFYVVFLSRIRWKSGLNLGGINS